MKHHSLYWFLAHINQRIYRKMAHVCCPTCDEVYRSGLIVHDHDHAQYLYDVQRDTGVEYTDIKPVNMASLLYPSEQYQARLRELGVRDVIDLGTLGELLPVGTQTVRVDSFWYCLSGHTLCKDVKQVDARAQMLIYLLEQELLKI